MDADPARGAEAYFLRTERLGLRTWHIHDLDLALALWGDPRVTRLFDARPQLDRVEVASRLQREIDTGRRYGIQYWPTFLIADQRFVGCCGLRPHGADDDLEFGVHLRPSHWRQGLASEAGRAVIAYAFENVGAASLFAGHHPDNIASARLLARLGFRYTHDELFPPTGRRHRSYRLTRDAWSAGRGGVDKPGGDAG